MEIDFFVYKNLCISEQRNHLHNTCLSHGLIKFYSVFCNIAFIGSMIEWFQLKTQSTLEFQIDQTVGKNLHGWKNDIDNGARATEMCPDIKAIGIWLAAIENL